MARHTNGFVRAADVRARALGALLSALTIGCAADESGGTHDALSASEHKQIDSSTRTPPDATVPAEDADADGAASATDAGPTTPAPSGFYVSDVKANGTGCPPGTWKTELSADGKHLAVRFSSYELDLTSDEAIAVADCSLAFELHTPPNVSFSLARAEYRGNADLEAGVVARQTAQYYFQGDPVSGGEARAELRGPFDDDFVLTNEIAKGDAVWSPCGVERDLNVITRLRLQNGEPRATGYLVLDRVLDVEFATRSCP